MPRILPVLEYEMCNLPGEKNKRSVDPKSMSGKKIEKNRKSRRIKGLVVFSHFLFPAKHLSEKKIKSLVYVYTVP